MSSHSTARPHFLSLPVELREPVYIFLLTLPSTPPCAHAFATDATPSARILEDVRRPHRAALLRTNRLIHAEATHLLYTLNDFTAHHTLLTALPSHALFPARPILNSRAVALITRWTIHVRLDVDARFTEEQVTRAFTGAQELTVDCSEAMYRSAGCGVALLFKGVRGVGRARVKGGGVDEGVRNWLQECMMKPVGWRDASDWREWTQSDDVWTLRGLDSTGPARAGGSASAEETYDIWTHGNR